MSLLSFRSLSSDGQQLLKEILNSPSFSSDFFSTAEDKKNENKPGETVRIACLDIGSYRPQDMSYRVEEGYVHVRGKRAQRINKGVEGSKFSRMIPIPEGVDPTRISARYSVRDGHYVIEGTKVTSSDAVRKRKSSYARFDETRMTLTVDLGDERVQREVCGNGLLENRPSKTNEKIVI